MRKFFYFLSNNVCTRSESDDIISPFYDYIYALYRNTFGRKNLFHDYAVPRYFFEEHYLYIGSSYKFKKVNMRKIRRVALANIRGVYSCTIRGDIKVTYMPYSMNA